MRPRFTPRPRASGQTVRRFFKGAALAFAALLAVAAAHEALVTLAGHHHEHDGCALCLLLESPVLPLLAPVLFIAGARAVRRARELRRTPSHPLPARPSTRAPPAAPLPVPPSHAETA